MEITCTLCHSGDVEDGFLEDRGEGSYGFINWIAGPLERGMFGGAKRLGKTRWAVIAYRCRACSHVMLFASDPS